MLIYRVMGKIGRDKRCRDLTCRCIRLDDGRIFSGTQDISLAYRIAATEAALPVVKSVKMIITDTETGKKKTEIIK